MTKLADSSLEELWFGEDDLPERERAAASSAALAAAKATGLKPFPVAALRLMRLLDADEFDQKAVIETFRTDMSLTSRLVHACNSPAFRGASPPTSAEQALFRLGAKNVRKLVASIAAADLFQDESGYGHRVHAHSVAVAAIADVLAKRWTLQGGEDAFLCGLMHDVGQLLLIQASEFSYDGLSEQTLSAHDQVFLRERVVLTYDHALIGAHALRLWGLPNLVAQAAASHHQPSRAYAAGGQVGVLVALLRAADQIEHWCAAQEDPERSSDAWLAELARGDACRYAELQADEIEDLWPRIAKARHDVMVAL